MGSRIQSMTQGLSAAEVPPRRSLLDIKLPTYRATTLDITHTIPSELRIKMDITSFIYPRRDQALLVGDYNYYRKQSSRRLLVVRKRLGRATHKREKYSAKPAITAQNVAHNHE